MTPFTPQFTVMIVTNVGLGGLNALAQGLLAATPRSNVLVVLTDDQDIYMDGADHQPKIKKLLRDQGATLTNAFVTTPVCCPSRSSFLTGQHIHNIPMTNNSLAGNCSGPLWAAGAGSNEFGKFVIAGRYVAGSQELRVARRR